jgi:ABC-type bacteriocin/lantibiotic exporter with double-glycine peptidase domain
VFRVQAYLTRWLNAFTLNLSRREKGRYPTGDIVNLAQTDSRHIAEFFAHAAVDFPVLFVSVSLIVAVMWSIVGQAAWIALLVLLLQIPVSVFFSWLGQKLHGELMRRSDTRLSLVTEWVQAARLVRYFGWSKKFVDDIRQASQICV